MNVMTKAEARLAALESAVRNNTAMHRDYMGRAMSDDIYSIFQRNRDETIPRLRSELLAEIATPTKETEEGCTPADAKMLRTANLALATESHELQEALVDIYQQVQRFCETNGEADFETGRALRLLSRLRPLEFSWPFAEQEQA